MIGFVDGDEGERYGRRERVLDFLLQQLEKRKEIEEIEERETKTSVVLKTSLVEMIGNKRL